MKWQEVREQFPDKWLLFAAVESHVTEDRRRIVDELAPIHAYTDFYEAWEHYNALHKKAPTQRLYLYVYHTSNDEIDIKLQYWVGIRGK